MTALFIAGYMICGLLTVYALLNQSAQEGGAVLPSELVAAFLFWWIIFGVQLVINAMYMIALREEDNDNNE